MAARCQPLFAICGIGNPPIDIPARRNSHFPACLEHHFLLCHTRIRPISSGCGANQFPLPLDRLVFFFDVNFSASLHFGLTIFFRQFFIYLHFLLSWTIIFFFFGVKFYLLDHIFSISMFISPSASLLFLGLFLFATKRHRVSSRVGFHGLSFRSREWC